MDDMALIKVWQKDASLRGPETPLDISLERVDILANKIKKVQISKH